jgi:hypothetical protein
MSFCRVYVIKKLFFSLHYLGITKLEDNHLLLFISGSDNISTNDKKLEAIP